jgi:hypothetical protein
MRRICLSDITKLLFFFINNRIAVAVLISLSAVENWVNSLNAFRAFSFLPAYVLLFH